MTFPFTIKTNASVAPLTTATKYGQTSTSPNISYSVVNTNGGVNAAPVIFAFSPNSCVLTSTAPNVDLGQVPLGSARNPGSVGWTTFSLNFSNCGAPEAAYTIQSTFSYTAYDASNPTLIANNGGTASNVGGGNGAQRRGDHPGQWHGLHLGHHHQRGEQLHRAAESAHSGRCRPNAHSGHGQGHGHLHRGLPLS